MQIRQITQISESHCAAAVLQMLLETRGVTTSQEMIAAVAGVEDSIEEHGMRLDQIATASNLIAPHLIFWYKFYASKEDLKFLLKQDIPVGVEWQGLFYDTVEEEEEEGKADADYGHYSIVTFFDEDYGDVIIVDPYKDFVDQQRIFDVETFMERWWDTNEVLNPHTGRPEIIEDKRLLFFVTTAEDWIPREMGFKQFRMASRDDD